MPCENCYSLAETIRELEAKIRYLESQDKPMFPVERHPDLGPEIVWKNTLYTSHKHE